jgi:hypothetical protein
MNEPTISIARLDYLTRMLADIKKTISYDKGSGQWSWVDRGCEDNQADYHTGFNTWLDAALDALEPYLSGVEDFWK